MLFQGLNPKRRVTYSVVFFDEDWCEVKELTRHYLTREQMLVILDSFASRLDTHAAGHAVEFVSKVIPYGLTVEVVIEQA